MTPPETYRKVDGCWNCSHQIQDVLVLLHLQSKGLRDSIMCDLCVPKDGVQIKELLSLALVDREGICDYWDGTVEEVT